VLDAAGDGIFLDFIEVSLIEIIGLGIGCIGGIVAVKGLDSGRVAVEAVWA
jgi:hypothetical protein